MRFGTRVFLLCFVPLTILLTFSFWIFERIVQNTVRQGMGASLRENQRAIGEALERGSLRNSRFLRVAGENAALKAGIQLLLSAPADAEARLTVEDQLDDLCRQMGFDLLVVSAPDGKLLAGVARKPAPAAAASTLMPLSRAELSSLSDGLLALKGRLFQIASVPINFGEEDLARLSVGEYFNLKEFSTPVALMRGGKVIAHSLDSVSAAQIEQSLRSCKSEVSCDVKIAASSYISLPVNGFMRGSGYSLRSFDNLDSAMAPINGLVRRSWLTLSLCALVAALAFGVSASRSVAGPIASMARRLKVAEKTGLLPEFTGNQSTIREVKELMESFNRAAAAVRESRDELHAAYIEFVGSLASALDARDRYTAGHSHRVSRLSCATADAMHLEPRFVERLRIGALLHDIGKIGIADEVLGKPGKLTAAEFAVIQLHPLIGRRILEGVNGFAPFLEAVELHHENWDGSGYPHRQKGEQTPIEARIIHVADAYDAMTTHRPYRQAMTHEQAIAILRRNAGTQFDPRIVDVFTGIAIFEHGEEFIPAVPVEFAEAV
jgi:HD-GYP domain-containing protein (c-di-GMP phosphodiesterase class II)